MKRYGARCPALGILKDYERLYHPSKLSCFRKCVDPEELEKITETILDRRGCKFRGIYGKLMVKYYGKIEEGLTRIYLHIELSIDVNLEREDLIRELITKS